MDLHRHQPAMEAAVAEAYAELVGDGAPHEISSSEQLTGLISRDKEYTRLLGLYIDGYKSKQSENKTYKGFFFWSTLGLFIVIICGSIYAIDSIAAKVSIKSEDIAIIISALGSIITSIIVIPKTIAEYLFPPKEDEYITQMVKNMQDNDNKVRDSMSGRNERE